MAVLITCKSNKDSNQNEMAIFETTFSKVYEAHKDR